VGPCALAIAASIAANVPEAAGADAAARIGELKAAHVIPRPGDRILEIDHADAGDAGPLGDV